jgi:hypothetical protein
VISKLINAFVAGFIFVLILDFLFFIGIKLNYFDAYNIKEYFNVIFFDNQNFLLFIPLSFLFGYLMLYSKIAKFFDALYLVMVLLFGLTLQDNIGKYAGEILFGEAKKSFKVGKTLFYGDILYQGREKLYIRRNDINKTIALRYDEVEVVD